MPLDPAQRHQIEQDAITAAWEAERLAACDDAIALLREIADLRLPRYAATTFAGAGQFMVISSGEPERTATQP